MHTGCNTLETTFTDYYLLFLLHRNLPDDFIFAGLQHNAGWRRSWRFYGECRCTPSVVQQWGLSKGIRIFIASYAASWLLWLELKTYWTKLLLTGIVNLSYTKNLFILEIYLFTNILKDISISMICPQFNVTLNWWQIVISFDILHNCLEYLLISPCKKYSFDLLTLCNKIPILSSLKVALISIIANTRTDKQVRLVKCIRLFITLYFHLEI